MMRWSAHMSRSCMSLNQSGAIWKPFACACAAMHQEAIYGTSNNVREGVILALVTQLQLT